MPRCYGREFAHRLINEALVVTKIQACLRAVIRHIDLTVLEWTHGARINVEVRIKFLHEHFETARLHNRSDGTHGDSFPERAADSSSHNDEARFRPPLPRGFLNACNLRIFHTKSGQSFGGWISIQFRGARRECYRNSVYMQGKNGKLTVIGKEFDIIKILNTFIHVHQTHSPSPTVQLMEVPAENPLLAALTDTEISRLIATHKNGMGETLRRCALGILQSGQNIDNTEELLRQYPDFQFGLEPNVQGIKFVLRNAPQTAFQQFHERGETRLHEFMREHLCAVVRDLVYQLMNFGHPQTTQEITDAIFRMLREVGVFTQTAKDRNGSPIEMNRVVAWGGHSIDHEEYAYGKLVGSAVAKQLCEFITGCGPGAMRAPFSGSIAAYHEERITNARHFGFTSPGIITSEPPNKFVNPLVILPDIEKRLEAFIRGSIGGIIFPGGVGTAEEIQTILSILIHPKNNNQQYPLIFTGPEKSRSYFAAIDAFLKETI